MTFLIPRVSPNVWTKENRIGKQLISTIPKRSEIWIIGHRYNFASSETANHNGCCSFNHLLVVIRDISTCKWII